MGAKIKICGLRRSQDIDFVNEARPDFIGFVFAKSRRQVTADEAKRLKTRLDDGILAVGVFVNAPPEEIADIVQRGIIDIVQLHGQEDNAYIARLRALLAEQAADEASDGIFEGGTPEKMNEGSGIPVGEDIPGKVFEGEAGIAFSEGAPEKTAQGAPGAAFENGASAKASDNTAGALNLDTRTPIIQAFRVESTKDVLWAQKSDADFLLLDNGTGGTGQTFDWSMIRDAVRVEGDSSENAAADAVMFPEMCRPFFLAGGLGPNNIGEALRTVRPFAVDMSSGVETDGFKDREKILAAVRAVRHAQEEMYG